MSIWKAINPIWACQKQCSSPIAIKWATDLQIDSPYQPQYAIPVSSWSVEVPLHLACLQPVTAFTLTSNNANTLNYNDPFYPMLKGKVPTYNPKEPISNKLIFLACTYHEACHLPEVYCPHALGTNEATTSTSGKTVYGCLYGNTTLASGKTVQHSSRSWGKSSLA